MDKHKHICKQVLSFISKHPIYSFIALFVFCLIIIPACILLAFFIGRQINILHIDYEAKDVLGFWGSFLGFIGTVVLGAITVFLSRKANDINSRLMLFEEKRHIYETRPFIRITSWDIKSIDSSQEPCFIYPNNLVVELKLDGETKRSDYCIFFEITNTGNIYTSVHLSEIKFFDNAQRTSSSRSLNYGYTNQNDWNLYLDVKSSDVIVIACSSELIEFIKTNKYVNFTFSLENSYGDKYMLTISALFLTISNNHVFVSNLSYKFEGIDT